MRVGKIDEIMGRWDVVKMFDSLRLFVTIIKNEGQMKWNHDCWSKIGKKVCKISRLKSSKAKLTVGVWMVKK